MVHIFPFSKTTCASYTKLAQAWYWQFYNFLKHDFLRVFVIRPICAPLKVQYRHIRTQCAKVDLHCLNLPRNTKIYHQIFLVRKKNPSIFEGLPGGQYFFSVLIHCTANPFRGPFIKGRRNLFGRFDKIRIFWEDYKNLTFVSSTYFCLYVM